MKVGFLLEFLSGERLASFGYLTESLGDKLDLTRGLVFSSFSQIKKSVRVTRKYVETAQHVGLTCRLMS